MSSSIIGSDQYFNRTEREVIAAIAQATIGDDSARQLPSAAQPEILTLVLAKAEHFGPRLSSGIELLCDISDPVKLEPAELLETLDRDPRLRSFSRIMTIVIMQSYYQHPGVLDALGLAARPPFPAGHEIPFGDWSLLDQVKQRKPFFRPA